MSGQESIFKIESQHQKNKIILGVIITIVTMLTLFLVGESYATIIIVGFVSALISFVLSYVDFAP